MGEINYSTRQIVSVFAPNSNRYLLNLSFSRQFYAQVPLAKLPRNLHYRFSCSSGTLVCSDGKAGTSAPSPPVFWEQIPYFQEVTSMVPL
jgi:hypothetical protein